MDISKLSPAPWKATTCEGEPIIYSESSPPGSNGIASVWVHGVISGKIKWNQDDHEFVALARNAFDVMTRRNWGANFNSQEGPGKGWYLMLPKSFYPLDWKFYPLADLRADDPFTLLIEADKWWKENVEKS